MRGPASTIFGSKYNLVHLSSQILASSSPRAKYNWPCPFKKRK